MEWQPIETAPKDGSRMLICDYHKRVFIGGYDPYWASLCWVSENTKVKPGYVPFMWMPLPTPPTPGQKER